MVQQALAHVFTRWGRPQVLRVDNGRPLGEPGSDIIPVMALWLIGKGIDLIWNRPRQPTDNAKVERMQGVTARWAEPWQCADRRVLEAHLEQAASIQRSLYRVRRLKGQTRAAAYPALLMGGPPYDREGFDLDRVLSFLAQGTWVRKVSKVGQIDFYGQRWYVGGAYRRQRVTLQLDLPRRQWRVCDEAGKEIKRFDGSFLSEAAICELSLSQRTDGSTT